MFSYGNEKQLEYCEDAEQVGDNMFEKRSNSNQLDIDQDCMTPSREASYHH